MMRPVDVIMRNWLGAISNNKIPDVDYIKRFADTFGLTVKISREQILVINRDGVVFVTKVRTNAQGVPSYFSHELGRVDIELPPLGEPSASRPPVKAEKLLSLLLPPTRIEEAMGDFDEGYAVMLDRYGADHARRWYRSQVMKVLARGLFDAACRVAKIWSGFGPA